MGIYPGKSRPGMPTSKIFIFPESNVPCPANRDQYRDLGKFINHIITETSATISIEPSRSAVRPGQSNITRTSFSVYLFDYLLAMIEKSSIFGGTIVPEAATPIATIACALASALILREAETGRQEMFLFKRLTFLSKSIGGSALFLSTSNSFNFLISRSCYVSCIQRSSIYTYYQ